MMPQRLVRRWKGGRRLRETGAHEMNDTTRDELTERVAELADQFACGAAGEPVVYALHGPMDFAEEVIALVRAAAWQEFEAGVRSKFSAYEGVMDAIQDYQGNYDDVANAVASSAWDSFEAALAATRAVPEPDGDAIERAARAMWDDVHASSGRSWEDAEFDQDIYRSMARAALAAVPTVQAAAGDDWLDTALDSVHPKTYISGFGNIGGEWKFTIRWPGEFSEFAGGHGRKYWSKGANWSTGTGPTRKAAVLNAVAKAKEAK